MGTLLKLGLMVVAVTCLLGDVGCSRRNQGETRSTTDTDAWEELQRRLGENPQPRSSISHNSKASVVHSLDTCVAAADLGTDTIIRTNASRAAGAEFLNTTSVDSERECVAKCCRQTQCNLAVVDSKLKPAKCFLFDCKHPTVCQFTRFAGYDSISLPRGSSLHHLPSTALSPPPDAAASPHLRRVNVPPPREPAPASTISPSTMAPQEADLDSWRLLMDDEDAKGDRSEDEEQAALDSPHDSSVSPKKLGDVIKLLQASKQAADEAAMTTQTPTTTTSTSTSTTTSHAGACGSDFEVLCANGDGCVALNDVCDGFAQCNDASDENRDVCSALKGREDGGVDGVDEGGDGVGDEGGSDGEGGSNSSTFDTEDVKVVPAASASSAWRLPPVQSTAASPTASADEIASIGQGRHPSSLPVPRRHSSAGTSSLYRTSSSHSSPLPP